MSVVETERPPVRQPRPLGPDEGSGDDQPCHVIVLNDDHNTFQGVAHALSSTLPSVSLDQGMLLANRIHDSGRAIVWSGHKEAAELYWSELRGNGLTMAPLERV
jgi:ATP-dependent Clp protease adaptor protein ClpS